MCVYGPCLLTCLGRSVLCSVVLVCVVWWYVQYVAWVGGCVVWVNLCGVGMWSRRSGMWSSCVCGVYVGLNRECQSVV